MKKDPLDGMDQLDFDPHKAKSIYVEDQNNPLLEEKAPKDTGSSYLMCLLFGIAAVLPWNVIIAAMDIFETKVLVIYLIFYSFLNTDLPQ